MPRCEAHHHVSRGPAPAATTPGRALAVHVLPGQSMGQRFYREIFGAEIHEICITCCKSRAKTQVYCTIICCLFP